MQLGRSCYNPATFAGFKFASNEYLISASDMEPPFEYTNEFKC